MKSNKSEDDLSVNEEEEAPQTPINEVNPGRQKS